MCLEKKSVNDAKVFELTGIVLPNEVDVLDNCSPRAAIAPFDKFLDLFFGPFADNLHSSVSEISNDAGEAKFVRFSRGVVTKSHALDETADQYLCASHH
jgi:hypothetical protein